MGDKIFSIFFLIGFLSGCSNSDLKSDFKNPVQNYALGYYEGDPLPNKVVYLTFDDGPSDWTADVLDVLKKENVKATFFVCGAWFPKSNRIHNSFQKYKETLIRMRNEGHVVGNHTFAHQNLAYISKEKIEKQLDENQSLYQEALGEFDTKFTIIRPPFGSPFTIKRNENQIQKVSSVLHRKGIIFMWSKSFDSSDSREWVRGEWYEKGPRFHPDDDRFREKTDRIYRKLISKADGKGFVILFHDTHPTTKEILPHVIDKLKEEGYTFGTAEDYSNWRWGMSSAKVLETIYH